MTTDTRNQALRDALREAFDSDSVPAKNIALRRAYDALAMQEPASEPAPASAKGNAMDIDAITYRFLGWKLPENFSPDGGISFTRDYNVGTPYQMKHEPVGTNLLSFDQAKAMFEYVLAEAEPAPASADCCGATIAEEYANECAQLSDDHGASHALNIAHEIRARASCRCGELREALEFYANPQVYKPDSVGRVGDLTFVAKNALAALTPSPEGEA